MQQWYRHNCIIWFCSCCFIDIYLSHALRWKWNVFSLSHVTSAIASCISVSSVILGLQFYSCTNVYFIHYVLLLSSNSISDVQRCWSLCSWSFVYSLKYYFYVCLHKLHILSLEIIFHKAMLLYFFSLTVCNLAFFVIVGLISQLLVSSAVSALACT